MSIHYGLSVLAIVLVFLRPQVREASADTTKVDHRTVAEAPSASVEAGHPQGAKGPASVSPCYCLAKEPSDTGQVEYSEVANNLRAGVTVLWDAFKTYFTVIALMFAGCGFLISKQDVLGKAFSISVVRLVACAGIGVTALGCVGVVRIIAYQNAFLERSIKLEQGLKASAFAGARVVWDDAFVGSDWLTYTVFSCFGVAWLLVILWCSRTLHKLRQHERASSQ